jgi:hypothetical protein
VGDARDEARRLQRWRRQSQHSSVGLAQHQRAHARPAAIAEVDGQAALLDDGERERALPRGDVTAAELGAEAHPLVHARVAADAEAALRLEAQEPHVQQRAAVGHAVAALGRAGREEGRELAFAAHLALLLAQWRQLQAHA